MKIFTQLFFIGILFTSSILSGIELTVASYNCGGLPDHYDYLRAASLQNLMEERYLVDRSHMETNEKIQKLALKILFAKQVEERVSAQQEWELNGYSEQLERIMATPSDPLSINYAWHAKINEMITPYNIRPIQIYDTKVESMLREQLLDLVQDNEIGLAELLNQGRAALAERIFKDSLKFDILCLQEADYLTETSIPSDYQVLISKEGHTKNGIAWKKERFELVKDLGSLRGRASIVQLYDRESDKVILVASGHISGCNPYQVVIDPITGISDSEKGDKELRDLIRLLDNQESDLTIIGMDSNVTALHPRLKQLKEANFDLDYENFLDPTCSNPHQVLNTRIDWIAIKNGETISNIAVEDVGLNNIQTNMSDHKPIAATISY